MSAAWAVPFADLALARRLEGAEAASNASFVEARARISPASGACWIEVGGANAMFDGVASPVTQTFGLGMFQAPAAADLDRIEAFFHERGAPAYHEVSPLADSALVPLLNERGYQPFEFTSVMYRPIGGQAGLKASTTTTTDTDTAVRHTDVVQAFRPAERADGAQAFRPTVRLIGEDEGELYARVAAEGWREAGYGDFMLEIGRVSANTDGLHLFVAELDGMAIAAGAVHLRDGVAHLAGASTIPAGRRRGAQLALLEHRLQYAAAHGCDIALMGASPGSGSQRNAERHGFRIAYTRVKWKR
jgi:acetyltransferase (GNAT) family protein